MRHGIGHADTIDYVLKHSFPPLTRPVVQDVQAIGPRTVGGDPIPQPHRRVTPAVVQRDVTGRCAQCPLRQVCRNPDPVLVHGAACTFQQVDGGLVVQQHTCALQNLETGAVDEAALIVRQPAEERCSVGTHIGLSMDHDRTSFLSHSSRLGSVTGGLTPALP